MVRRRIKSGRNIKGMRWFGIAVKKGREESEWSEVEVWARGMKKGRGRKEIQCGFDDLFGSELGLFLIVLYVDSFFFFTVGMKSF